jgi:2-haloalkanoic acid dehalogenase type II
VAGRVSPELFTFDLFGTVLDWRRGLREAIESPDALGRTIADDEFDRIIDVQGELESSDPSRHYRDIVAESLVRSLGVDRAIGDAIGRSAGTWPLYPDSGPALERLMRIAPCVAMTNSDLLHRPQIEAQLGFSLSGWFCAEEVRVYKPARAFWERVSAARGIAFSKAWWHVSAYGDYDLETASKLGLTGVFVERPHARTGPHDVRVDRLTDLFSLLPRS